MDVFLSKIRKYLKDDSSVEIINVHGKGYKLLVIKSKAYPDLVFGLRFYYFYKLHFQLSASLTVVGNTILQFIIVNGFVMLP